MAMLARASMLFRSAPAASQPAAYVALRAMSTEIPINSVARVVRYARGAQQCHTVTCSFTRPRGHFSIAS